MLKQFFVLLPLIATSLLHSTLMLPASGQASPAPSALPPPVLCDMRRLHAEALKTDYSWEQTAYLTDNIGARPNGSPQQQAAIVYVADQMRKLGFDVRIEPVKIPHWVRGEERAALVTYPGQVKGATQEIVLTALGSSVATPADGITAEVVVVRDFAELHALGRDKVAGKIVVFNRAFDNRLRDAGFASQAYGEVSSYRHAAPVEAARLGAVAVIVRSAGGADFRLPHTGGTGYAKDVPKIPAAATTAEDASLMERLARQGPVRMKLVLTPKTLPDATTYNVIADLKGSEHPEQVVIVSGHLDSWDVGTGALDDAAGVAIAMDALRMMKQLGLKPKRTVRMIAWAAEEIGIHGGIAYFLAHQKETANHYAAIESDLGAGHPLGIYVDADPAILPLLQPIRDVLQASGAGVVTLSDLTGADLIPLGTAGVPTFSPIHDARKYFDYHHTAADTLDKVDPKELRENAAVVAVLAYALASLEGNLPRTPKPVPMWLKASLPAAP